MMTDPEQRLKQLKRQVWHQLVDLSFFIFSGVMALLWDHQGHHRESFLLLAVTYWGMPWARD